MGHRAAIFVNKALVTRSSCILHPRYQALRAPRIYSAKNHAADYCSCQDIWDALEGLRGPDWKGKYE